MTHEPVKVGVMGCGNISSKYFGMCGKFPILDIVACADLIPERAQAQAAAHGISRVCSPEQLLADPTIEIIVNITVPKAHYEIALAAIRSGKSVWNEKPLAVTRAQGKELVEAAREHRVLLGCAPDTFLGAGLQTTRKLLDDGWIGDPIAATGFFLSPGPENWHPNPEFVYKAGAGPMLDMGPYYLTALVVLLGGVRRVSGSARITFPRRMITSQPRYGQMITVDVPTFVSGVLDFDCGAVGTVITSMDVWASELPHIEIYGTEGSLSVPDPNDTKGPVRVRRAGADSWSEVPLTHPYAAVSRSTGVADMAYALRTGRPHRASGELAYHILDIAEAIQDASTQGRHIELTSSVERPDPLPLDLREGELDE